MKLSTKGRHGLRIMLDLALNEGKGHTALKDISKRQGISEKYLWRLIDPLRSAGLVQSNRGAKGGYILGKALTSITLNDIVSVLEGTVFLTECIERPSTCSRSDYCVARDIWQEASEKISATLKTMTLKYIVERHKTKTEGAGNYAI
ncbi:MAG: Rrf2 family transcriptional regulator [Pseudomonadota bacterium]